MNDNRAALMKEVQIAQFSLIETNLYLDTHPCDEDAMKALDYYAEKLSDAMEKYEEQFGSLTAGSCIGTPFDWIKEPFPWETEC